MIGKGDRETEAHLAQELGEILKSLGYSLQEEARVAEGRRVVTVDVLAQKEGRRIALEIRSQPASIDALAALVDVQADVRMVIAPGWADSGTQTVASANSIVLIRPEDTTSLRRVLEAVR